MRMRQLKRKFPKRSNRELNRPNRKRKTAEQEGPGKRSTPAETAQEETLARYRDITLSEMTLAQRRVHDLIVAGPRGRFGGPFQLLIRAPEICEHAAKLGEHLRWGTSLPDRLSELAIITTARFWRAQYEWFAHAPLAEKAGVPAAVIEVIRRGETVGHRSPQHRPSISGSMCRR